MYSRLVVYVCFFFFFQAEDGIRDLVRSRGLGDVYKRQGHRRHHLDRVVPNGGLPREHHRRRAVEDGVGHVLSLIHI